MKVSLDRRHVEEQTSKGDRVEEDKRKKEKGGMNEGWNESRRKLAQAERRNNELKQLLDLKVIQRSVYFVSLDQPHVNDNGAKMPPKHRTFFIVSFCKYMFN